MKHSIKIVWAAAHLAAFARYQNHSDRWGISPKDAACDAYRAGGPQGADGRILWHYYHSVATDEGCLPYEEQYQAFDSARDVITAVMADAAFDGPWCVPISTGEKNVTAGWQAFSRLSQTHAVYQWVVCREEGLQAL